VSLDLRSGCDLRTVSDEPFRSADRVWFLAWDTGGAKYLEATNTQHMIFKNNCELAARVFDCLERTQCPFLFATSQLAGLRNGYGMSKLLGETWAAELGGHVVRLWNVYGWEPPGQRSHVIPDLVLTGLRERRIRCRTSGAERRRLLYKTDCVEGMIRFFDQPIRSCDLAGEEWHSIAEVAAVVAQLVDAELSFADGKGTEVLLDPSSQLSGWAPAVPLVEGIGMVVADARRYVASGEAS
jgi:nucleoside-diphosphate-sugar epimerase